ncbi:MAG: hypothetical protein ACI4VP_01940 [Clostridia bacterium]
MDKMIFCIVIIGAISLVSFLQVSLAIHLWKKFRAEETKNQVNPPSNEEEPE